MPPAPLASFGKPGAEQLIEAMRRSAALAPAFTPTPLALLVNKP